MKLQMLLVGLVGMMLVGCGKQSSSNSGSTKFNRVQGNGVVGTTSCNTSQWGRIYDNSTNEVAFQQRVADFTLRPLDQIGEISPYSNGSTGIDVQMTLRFQGGQLVQGSTASFKISDSFTLAGEGVISFGMQGMQGQGANGQFNAAVGDQKGYVRFEGSRAALNGQTVVYGRAYYNNTIYGNSEQFLGEFVVHSCAVVGI